MSRIGKLPVTVPAGVKVDIQNNVICVEGPKGKLCQDYTANVKVELNDGVISVVRVDESKASNAAQGLYRNLINNMVTGVTVGFTKNLIITGVGFRAEVQGNLLVMNLGYSSDFIAMIPENLTVTVGSAVKKLSSGFFCCSSVFPFSNNFLKLLEILQSFP